MIPDLDKVLTWEQFQAELSELPTWISKHPRPLRFWLYSVERWASGDR